MKKVYAFFVVSVLSGVLLFGADEHVKQPEAYSALCGSTLQVLRAFRDNQMLLDDYRKHEVEEGDELPDGAVLKAHYNSDKEEDHGVYGLVISSSFVSGFCACTPEGTCLWPRGISLSSPYYSFRGYANDESSVLCVQHLFAAYRLKNKKIS